MTEPGAPQVVDNSGQPPPRHPMLAWFAQFLDDRQTRKPSAHTMKAYRQDFVAIATLVTAGDPANLEITDITKESMRAAFAAYAR